MGKTLTEKLTGIEVAEEKLTQTAEKSTPSSFIFQTRSGTKDIIKKFNIGGNYTKKKKVIRNPIPIFGGVNFVPDNEVKGDNTSRPATTPIEAAKGTVNITRLAKLKNTDVFDTQARTQKVFGMFRMGGTGTDNTGNSIQKIEELKLLKNAPDIYIPKNMKENKGKWKGGL